MKKDKKSKTTISTYKQLVEQYEPKAKTIIPELIEQMELVELRTKQIIENSQSYSVEVLDHIESKAIHQMINSAKSILKHLVQNAKVINDYTLTRGLSISKIENLIIFKDSFLKVNPVFVENRTIFDSFNNKALTELKDLRAFYKMLQTAKRNLQLIEVKDSEDDFFNNQPIFQN